MAASRKRSCFAWMSRSVAAIAGLVAACDPSPAPTVSTAATAASAPAATATGAPIERAADELKPVYPVDAGPPNPVAQRFCEAIHTLPGARYAACCGPGGATADTVAGQCVRTLSFAIAERAVTLAEADVDTCVEAMTKATSGCDWVVSFGGVAIPPACEGIVKGVLGDKARCRSSLECQAGLRCQGLSTIDLGACAPPKPPKTACNLAVDMLASFTRQDHVDRDHPECDGFCARSRCEPAVAEGGACRADLACGKGRCVAGKCTSAPAPAVGEPCSTECAHSARCVKGKCAAPKSEGDACELNEECRGVCDKSGGSGRCQKSCPVVRLPVLNNMPAPTGTAKRR